MTQQTVGLIGGVGPGSTAVFYQAVVGLSSTRHGGDQPPLLIYSIPMAASIEAAILGGATAGPEVERLVGLLETGVSALARAGVDAISMPCNTLQGYLPPIVARAGLPYIPLIGATAEHIQRAGYRRAGGHFGRDRRLNPWPARPQRASGPGAAPAGNRGRLDLAGLQRPDRLQRAGLYPPAGGGRHGRAGRGHRGLSAVVRGLRGI